MRRLILASHVIFSTYGFWLPNDPRGSWSEFVRKWELRRFGTATKVTTRQSRAHVPHDRELRLAAKEALDYPPVSFTGEQARAIGEGFRSVNVALRKTFDLYANVRPAHVVMRGGRYDKVDIVLVRSLTFVPQLNQLAVVDGRLAGLLLVSLSSMSVSRQWF